eukprot:1494460-Ditylum_brightwellii.AAC.1
MAHPAHVEENLSTFLEYITILPEHAALHCRDIHIATDGSVAHKRGYYVVVFYTDGKVLKFQGPCDGSPILVTSFYT